MAKWLQFDEDTLDQESSTYLLYDRLYKGMLTVKGVEMPSYVEALPYERNSDDTDFVYDDFKNKVIDTAAIQSQIEDYSRDMTKNAAMMFAQAIVATLGEGTGSGSSVSGNYLSRSGDSMSGKLTANSGFEAGISNVKLIEARQETEGEISTYWVEFYNNVKVNGDCESTGVLKASKNGIYLAGTQVLSYDDTPNNTAVLIGGAPVRIDNDLTVHDFKVDAIGAYWGNHIYYHAGNSNLKTVDWAMKDGLVNGNLTVKGDASLEGAFSALYGFELGVNGNVLLDSQTDENANAWIQAASDIDFTDKHGIRLNGNYVLKMRNESEGIVSFSAPGMIINLGDSNTIHVSLQAGIYDYTHSDELITKEGRGYFPNGLTAQHSRSGENVLQTATWNSRDGVVFGSRLWLGSTNGPELYQYTNNNDDDPKNGGMGISLSFSEQDKNHIARFCQRSLSIAILPTTNAFIDPTIADKTVSLDTDGDMFELTKGVEATFFSVKKDGTYSTALLENQLFFKENQYLECATGGIRWVSNAYFTSDLSSIRFSSGFAGSGWAIMKETLSGGIHATFDSLTVRKKMRVYELEVQKISVTNGSLWVSDSCSGDEVVEII